MRFIRHSYLMIIFSICFTSYSSALDLNIIDTGEVPFELIKGAIVVPVKIDNSLYRFVLDTGGYLTVSEQLKNEHSLEVVSSIEVSDINRNVREFSMVAIPKMSIGNWDLSNRESILSDSYKVYPTSCFELDGMIGRDLLKDVFLLIDYSTKMLRITNQSNLLSMDKVFSTKMKISKRGLPSVKMEINGKKQFIEFDSGSRDWFSYKTADLSAKSKRANKDIQHYKGVFSFGVSGKDYTPENRYRRKMDKVKIGGVVFENSYSDLSKKTAPRIGAGLLRYGVVLVDYINNYFYYKGFEDKAVKIDLSHHGFAIAKVEGKYIIKWVLKDSEASEKGLSFGDEIITINGSSIEELNDECYNYINDYPMLDEEKLLLKILKPNGVREEVVIDRMRF